MSILTIGIPVYNGQEHLLRALNSIRSQTFTDFTVIISDNDSTDATARICNEFLLQDGRFSYVKQQSNIGAFNNFKFLLDQCQSQYFVFLAADDYWLPDYLLENIAALNRNPSAVCSVSMVDFENNSTYLSRSNGTFAISGTVKETLRQFFYALPNDNSRFYGVYRTDAFQKSFADIKSFHASDWLIMAKSLLYGTHNEVAQTLMCREVAEPNRYVNQASMENKNFLYAKLPVLEMTLALRGVIGNRQFISLLWLLIVLNFRKYREYRTI